MKCPYCNAEISDDSLFCGSCGKKLPQKKDCVKCGKSIETNSDFCPYCGAKQNLSVSTSKESEKPLTSPSSVQQSKKSSKVVSFIASCILALAVLGGAAYYWFEIREDYSLEGLAQVSKGEYELFHFEKGFAAVKVGNNMGVINKQGEMIAPVKYIFKKHYDICYAVMSDDRMRLAKKVNDKDKFGYIDKTGKEVIPFEYDDANNFSEGLAKVKKNGKYGFIDTHGKEVIPFIYDYATSFSNGLASVTMNAKKPGCMFIDKKGNVVLSLEDYSCYGGFFPDEGKVVIYEDDSYEDDWYTVGTFSDEGLALINKDGKWGLMDKAGKIVTDCVYGGVLGYSEGYYQVRKDGKDGFVDDYFKEVIPCNYFSTFAFKEGVAKVCVDREAWDAGKWSLIDTNGNILIPDAKDIDDFYEGVAVYKKNDRFGYVDKYGNEVIPSIFESAGHFSEGLASVKKNGMFGYIDKNGIETIPFIYEDAKDFSEGLALVKKNDRWGYVDKKGKSTFDYQ